MRVLHRQQGQLDCLCGLYSIVNAITEINPNLSNKDAEQLFKALCTYLKGEGLLFEALTEGCYIPLISKMLHVAKNWLEARHSRSMVWRKPFHKNSAALPSEVFDVIGGYLGEKDGTCITGFEGKISHWTVISAISPKRLSLLDSDGRKHIRRDMCRSHLETSEDRFYWVYPSAVFLLELT